MLFRRVLGFCLPAVLLSISQADAQNAATKTPVPAYGSIYVEIKKPFFNREWPIAMTVERQRAVMLDLLRSKYGHRGTRTLFKDLAGHGAVDLSIPGVTKNLLLTTSDNPNVAKGARRTQLYVTKLSHDPRFKILALNEPVKTPLGNTDKDLRYSIPSTGTTGRIEIKDLQLDSQRRNVKAYMRQMDKMHSEFRRTGELQSFLNRRDVTPELKAYARDRGITVYENVVTGEQSAKIKGANRIETVIDDMARRHIAVGRTRVLSGGSSTAFGLLLTYEAVPQAWHDVRDLIESENRNEQRVLRALHGTTLSASGLAQTVAGGSTLMRSVVTNARTLEFFTATGRWGGGIATATFLIAEGIIIWQYNAGQLTPREFWSHEAGLVGAL